jgi:hypothetical protein
MCRSTSRRNSPPQASHFASPQGGDAFAAQQTRTQWRATCDTCACTDVLCWSDAKSKIAMKTFQITWISSARLANEVNKVDQYWRCHFFDGPFNSTPAAV